MGATEDNIHAELDDIAMNILNLSQDLIKAKIALEDHTKSGFLGLAQSRKLMGGPSSVSHLQIPSEDSDDFTLFVGLNKRSDCFRSHNLKKLH